jgi:hypothetical protein
MNKAQALLRAVEMACVREGEGPTLESTVLDH